MLKPDFRINAAWRAVNVFSDHIEFRNIHRVSFLKFFHIGVPECMK